MSFKPYPKYKESGVEWLGRVPEHWELQRLKDIAAISGGGTPSREVPEYWNGDIPWVSPKDMKTEEIDRAEESITELGLSQSTSTLHPPGRVLMVIRSGILQRVVPVAITKAPVAINQDLKAIAFDVSRCLPSFFLRWVQGWNDVLLLAWAQQGATVESINQSLMRNSVLPLPSVEEQFTISAFLDRETAKIDALIAEQQRLIELLQEKRQAVISHAVTKGLNPAAPMKDSGIEWLGEVPEHWQIERGRFLYSQVEIPPEDQDGVVTAFRDGQVTLRSNRRTEGFTVAVLEVGYQRVREGDLVIHGMDAFAGAIGVSESTGKCTPEYAVLQPIQQGTCNAYYAKVLRLMAHRNFIYVICPSVRERAPRFRFESFKGVMLPVPPADEQHEIIRHVSAQEHSLASLAAEAERAIALLQERRSALISAAVTGQIDVRDHAGGSEAA
ncbi:MAG: restriction endonuclease subunit S [Planctomycetes bacterium]|nr:restriction endonuclease subunit S [Planctomycetota bacterium]